MNVKDYLDRDDIVASLNELVEDMENYDDVGPIILAWDMGEETKVRQYGNRHEIPGLLLNMLWVQLGSLQKTNE